MWLWMVANANTLTADQIWQEFKKHPMITVTKEEDKTLPKAYGDFKTRYKDIEVITLDADPYSYIK